MSSSQSSLTEALFMNPDKPQERQIISWLADRQTPAQLFEYLAAHQPMAFLLESSDGDKRLARFSLLGSQPKFIASLSSGQWTLHDPETNETKQVSIEANKPLAILQQLQESFISKQSLPLDLPFTGGWVGYWGYGMTHYFENIPLQKNNPLGMPDAYLGLYDTVLVFDHLYRQLHLIGNPNCSRFKAIYNALNAQCQSTLTVLKAPSQQFLSMDDVFSDVTASMAKQDYCNKVLQAKEWIKEGQVFQIVLAQRFSLEYTLAPFDAYRILQALNPSPYAYYLKFPDSVYFGASPETCMSYQHGKVTLRALAGTRHRGSTPEEDSALAIELKSNAKEMAEHKMLVDLARNDLGKLSIPGSVTPGEIAEIVYYTHVMHLSTEVTGNIAPGKSAYDVIPACFPRGTVSGAPKIRAMQLLEKLEPEQRGIYAGMVGYLDISGNLDAAIAIRSALIKDNIAHVQAGAGIVFDSDPEFEYEETRNKARSVLTALQLAKQLHEAKI